MAPNIAGMVRTALIHCVVLHTPVHGLRRMRARSSAQRKESQKASPKEARASLATGVERIAHPAPRRIEIAIEIAIEIEIGRSRALRKSTTGRTTGPTGRASASGAVGKTRPVLASNFSERCWTPMATKS